MTITKTMNGNTVTLAIEGRLDTTTAGSLESAFAALGACGELVLDMEKLAYISSAGLRVLLARQKECGKLGRMVLKNVNDDVMDVFEVTGFVDVLNIE